MMRWQQGRARIKKPGKQNCCKIEPQTPGNECPEHKRNVAKSRNGETDENIWKIRLFEKSRRLVPGKRPGKRNGLQIGAKGPRRNYLETYNRPSPFDQIFQRLIVGTNFETTNPVDKNHFGTKMNPLSVQLLDGNGKKRRGFTSKHFRRTFLSKIETIFVERLCRTVMSNALSNALSKIKKILVEHFGRKLEQFWSNAFVVY